MTLGTKLLILLLLLLAYALVTAVYRILGDWSDKAISKHDLILESQRRRAAYYDAVAERRGLSSDSVEVVD